MKMLAFPIKVRAVAPLPRVARRPLAGVYDHSSHARGATEGKTHALADRARKYVEKMPPAIAGSGGHDALFAVASTLIHGFDLSEHEAWPIVLEYNSRCIPPWSEGQLRHKMADASCLSRHPKPRGHLRGVDVGHDYRLPKPEKPERMVWEVKPVPLPDRESPIDPHSEKAISEEHTEPAPARAVEKPSVAEPEDIEANRIAGELRKLKDAGALKEPEDPPFFKSLIRIFEATFLSKGTQEPTRMAGPPRYSQVIPTPDGNPPPGIFVRGKPYTPTEQQRVRIPYGLTYAERQRFLQDDLDSLNN